MQCSHAGSGRGHLEGALGSRDIYAALRRHHADVELSCLARSFVRVRCKTPSMYRRDMFRHHISFGFTNSRPLARSKLSTVRVRTIEDVFEDGMSSRHDADAEACARVNIVTT